ncbi:MAG: hypothetical protein AB8B93_17260 [Pseudomonadales bacterium]
MLSPIQKSLISATAGALLYGGWGYYANSSAGTEMAMRTGIVQGSYSFVLTLSMTLLLEWGYGLLGRTRNGAIVTLAIVSGLMFSTAYALQYFAGSEAILMTILPGYVVGTIYAATYLGALHRSPAPTTTND